MAEMEILCWNVNGIRAVGRKGFLQWLTQRQPGILCLQEIRVQDDQFPADIRQPAGYLAYWNFPARKGYSGVATVTKEEPLYVNSRLDDQRFDVEGRLLMVRYPRFTLLNTYFPNGKMSRARLQYKMDFYEAFLALADRLRSEGESLVVCGDFNTAHREIDLARPRDNQNTSGFLPMERAWMDRLVAHGFVDTFRQFNRESGNYTWWDMKTRARERNVGWRLDYFFVSEDLLPFVTNASIFSDVFGSDHCPVGITLSV